MDLNETICFCADVTAGDIKKAYDEGHTTVDAIGEATEAGTYHWPTIWKSWPKHRQTIGKKIGIYVL